ncbi:hypothetical protein BZA77DRAFT_290990 [Pyronema omphalodes]|nr:hypothetical protein BZA77DRAFT_290990 [Pyronema omphalodes]
MHDAVAGPQANMITNSKLITFVNLKLLNVIKTANDPILCQDTTNPARRQLVMANNKNKNNVVGSTFCQAEGSASDRSTCQLMESVVSVPTISVVSSGQSSTLFTMDNTTQQMQSQKHKGKRPKLQEVLQKVGMGIRGFTRSFLRLRCRDCSRQKNCAGKSKEGSGINKPLPPLPVGLSQAQIPVATLTIPGPSTDPMDSASSEIPSSAPVEILPEMQFAVLDLMGSSSSIRSFDSKSSRIALPPTRKSSVVVNMEEAPKINDDKYWSLNLTPVDIRISGLEQFMVNYNGNSIHELSTNVTVSRIDVSIS